MDLFLRFNSLGFRVCARLLITLGLVKLCHLINPLLVLTFDLKLELELVKHPGDPCCGDGRVGLDKIQIAVDLFRRGSRPGVLGTAGRMAA